MVARSFYGTVKTSSFCAGPDTSWVRKYGDFFMFVDVTRFDSGEFGAYGEASPRFSFLKMAGASPLDGFVQDFLISTTYEKGEEGVQTFLYGGGLDLNIPGFNYFKTNLYVRDNPNLSDETWQITLSWQYPFSLGPVNFVTEGFADFAGSAAPRYHSNQLIVPRLLMDVGDLVGLKKGRLWTGVEYTYWHNKFGVNGVTESVPQLQIKWVF